MRKIVSIFAVGLLFLTACDGGKLKQVESENVQLDDSLRVALSNQDSLLVLLNDITDGMNQIKDLEKILGSTNDLTAESQSRKDQIRNDMYSIQQALQERRERLAELEKKLADTGGESSTLKRTVSNLKAQIAEQQTEIATLTNQLASANIRIEELNAQVSDLNSDVDSLNTGLTAEREQKEAAQEAATAATNELNTVYYAIGTGKELKEKKILESGFLRKTKVMKGDFDMSYFTAGDRRTLTVIPTHSNKAKVLTSQPKDSYTIMDQNGQKVIKITDPAKFWQLSNFLVIEVG